MVLASVKMAKVECYEKTFNGLTASANFHP